MSKRQPQRTGESLDAWAGSVPPKRGCQTCGNREAAEAVRACLVAIERTGAKHITLRQILKKVQELVPTYKTGYWGFREHIYRHEAELYNKAKGKEI